MSVHMAVVYKRVAMRVPNDVIRQKKDSSSVKKSEWIFSQRDSGDRHGCISEIAAGVQRLFKRF